MKNTFHRLLPVLCPLLIGVVVGFLANEATRSGSGRAAASPNDTKSQRAAEPAKGRQADARTRQPKQVRRVGSAVGLNRETVEQYLILHRHVWPKVLARIRESNIRNYSIYMGELDDGQLYLFSYFEYVGDDFEADMEAVGNDPVVREWWKLTDPLQKRIKRTPPGDQWKGLTEVFHSD